jgi:DMSO/TMAO reductase YedYZ molybdopterin-dependent catalytic subunit
MFKTSYKVMILLVVLVFMLSGCSFNNNDVPTTTQITGTLASTNNEISSEDYSQETSVEPTSGITDTTAPVTTIDPSANSETVMTTVPTTTVPKSSANVTTAFETEANTENLLKITGKVAYEMTITLDELKSMDAIVVEEDFYSKNSSGTTGHTKFKGVNLWLLLEEWAGIDAKASKVTVLANDGYKMTFTIEQVMKQDYLDETAPDKKLPMIIAWEENGIEYNPEDGPPYQLVVGQIVPGDFNKFQWVTMVVSIVVE